jgi:spore maturation protein CgeB
LFEAAACGVPIVSDWWEGLDAFFTPGAEIIVAHTTEEAVEAVQLSDTELSKIAAAARERVLSDHTAAHRAGELERIFESALSSSTSERDEPCALTATS